MVLLKIKENYKNWNPEVISPVVSLPHSKLTTNISRGAITCTFFAHFTFTIRFTQPKRLWDMREQIFAKFVSHNTDIIDSFLFTVRSGTQVHIDVSSSLNTNYLFHRCNSGIYLAQPEDCLVVCMQGTCVCVYGSSKQQVLCAKNVRHSNTFSVVGGEATKAS